MVMIVWLNEDKMDVNYDDDDDNPDPAARLRGCPSCEASMLPTQSDEAPELLRHIITCTLVTLHNTCAIFFQQ